MLEIKTEQNVVEFAKLIAESLVKVLETVMSKSAAVDESIVIWNALGIERIGFQSGKVILYARNPYTLIHEDFVPAFIWDRLQDIVEKQYGWTLAVALHNPNEIFEKDFQVYGDVYEYFGPYIEKLFYNNGKLGD